MPIELILDSANSNFRENAKSEVQQPSGAVEMRKAANLKLVSDAPNLRVFGSTTRKRTPKRVKFLIGAQVEAVAKARRHRARPRDDRRACQPEVGAAELRRGNDADLPGCLVCYAKRGGRHRRVIARPFRMYRRGRSPYSRVAGDRSSPVPQVSRTCCREPDALVHLVRHGWQYVRDLHELPRTVSARFALSQSIFRSGGATLPTIFDTHRS